MTATQRRRPLASRARTASTQGEHGFGLVEIIAVLVVVAILMTILVTQMRGGKRISYNNETKAAAAAYDQAIASFQADAANRNPVAADMMTIGSKPAGPRNLLNKPYIKQLPDGVVSGRITVSMACAAPTTASAKGHIAYCPGTAPEYTVRAYGRDGDDAWELMCVLGNSAATPRC